MSEDKVTVYAWSEMPKQELWDGKLRRTALRTDQTLVCYNWFAPGTKRVEPHSHPFDQLVMVVEGRMHLEVDGKVFQMGPGTSARVPSGVPHTAWPVDKLSRTAHCAPRSCKAATRWLPI